MADYTLGTLPAVTSELRECYDCGKLIQITLDKNGAAALPLHRYECADCRRKEDAARAANRMAHIIAHREQGDGPGYWDRIGGCGNPRRLQIWQVDGEANKEALREANVVCTRVEKARGGLLNPFTRQYA